MAACVADAAICPVITSLANATTDKHKPTFGQAFCYKFQVGKCNDEKCKFKHLLDAATLQKYNEFLETKKKTAGTAGHTQTGSPTSSRANSITPWLDVLCNLTSKTGAPVFVGDPLLGHRELYTLCHVSADLQRAVLAHLPAIALLLGKRIIGFDTETFDLSRHLCAALGIPGCDLDRLHLLLPGVEPPSLDTRRGKWRHTLTHRWNASLRVEGSALMDSYSAWMRHRIAPLLVCHGESHMYYSRLPLLRHHAPCCAEELSRTLALHGEQRDEAGRKLKRPAGVSITRHTDGDAYGIPPGSVNVWLPLSSHAWGSNSLVVEDFPWSEEGSGSALDLLYGEAMLFYGNGCHHYTVPNTTGVCRTSLDFRFIPGSLFDA
ncbi:unnamed protein product, partial [Polarella glacialis]